MKKVLVIEDNEKNMYLISFILKTNKHKVLKAVTGEEGVELAIKKRPDLILADIQLPGINGLEVVKRLRKVKECANIPIIAITSFAMSGDREKLIKGGCNGYIEKPINLKTLMPEIKKYI